MAASASFKLAARWVELSRYDNSPAQSGRRGTVRQTERDAGRFSLLTEQMRRTMSGKLKKWVKISAALLVIALGWYGYH